MHFVVLCRFSMYCLTIVKNQIIQYNAVNKFVRVLDNPLIIIIERLSLDKYVPCSDSLKGLASKE